jgi:hypothetical protein
MFGEVVHAAESDRFPAEVPNVLHHAAFVALF